MEKIALVISENRIFKTIPTPSKYASQNANLCSHSYEDGSAYHLSNKLSKTCNVVYKMCRCLNVHKTKTTTCQKC